MLVGSLLAGAEFSCVHTGLHGPDAEGLYTYTRPEGKSGGHGVGWTEIPRYSFKVPPGWSEKAVSIADLGGTEVCPPLWVRLCTLCQ